MCAPALQRGEVLGRVAQAVEVAGDAAQVAQRRQQPVEPQAAAQVSVLDVRLAQLGVGLAVGRQADVLAQPARLLDEVHVGHDLRRHLAEPLRVDRGHRHRHEEDEDLDEERVRGGERMTGLVYGRSSSRCDAAEGDGGAADLEGLPLVQQVPGVVHGVDGEVQEGAR